MDLPHATPATADTVDGVIPPQMGFRANRRRQVELVAGSTPRLSDETRDLLRSRLRASALILFTGFLVFLLRLFFLPPGGISKNSWDLVWAHIFVTVLTGTVGLILCRRCSMSLFKLRAAELLIFGAPAIFFLLMQYRDCENCIREGLIPHLASPWLLLIFTYALFVPNTWQRAAVVAGLMAAAPILLAFYFWLVDPSFISLIRSMPDVYGNYLFVLTMLMSLGFFTASFGVYTIGTLRRQAFEARQLGQYRLKEKLGEGGMGQVYLAEHQLMKRPCAIKVIHPQNAGDPRTLARFEREVRATARLSHWNTVEIYDYGSGEDGTFYYVMEYLPGLSLAQLVERHGPIEPARAIYLIMQTCDALSEAHCLGLIHRDIKPGNIFAAHRGGVHDVAKLLDFGLAKPIVDAAPVSLTQEGTIAGSPLFMSPEQVLGEHEPDARSDIYSLGAVLYFLLTGQPPFDDDKPMKVMFAHAHQEVVPPTQISPAVPKDLELIVLRCLAKRPEDRYQDARSLRQALAACAAAGQWTREAAADWWRNHGCPKKRAFDVAALEAAAVG